MFMTFTALGSGSDRFGPHYLVGNVPNGDSAIPQADPFRYIPDIGDGAGIALALAEAAVSGGSVWIRRGTYTKAPGQLRFVVPVGIRVWGEGDTTIIVGNATDNTIFELGASSSIAWMQVIHPGPLAPVGTAVIACTSPATHISNLSIDVSAATAGGILNAGVLYSGAGSATLNFAVFEQNAVLGPPGTGLDPLDNPANVPLMFACVRGAPGVGGSQQVISIKTCNLAQGDVAVMSVGVTTPGSEEQASVFLATHILMVQPAVAALYMDNAVWLGFHNVLLKTAGAAMVAGKIFLNNSQYEDASTFMLNFSGAVPAAPGIILSSPAPQFSSGIRIHDCFLAGWGGAANARFPAGVPQIALGYLGAADIVRSCNVNGNTFASAAGVIPVILDFGCSNSIVAINTSDGSGGVLPLDNGGGNAPNVNNLWT